MLQTVADFVQALRHSRLLEPAQLNEVKGRLSLGLRGPRTLAAKLTECGWLTEYQARKLLEGDDSELVLGPYRILDLIGEGGLCQVFKAFHAGQQRIVALKVVHPELRANPEVLDQIRLEMEVIARLSHPNFIKAVDVSLGRDRYYFAMEFIEGIDLSRLLRIVGPLPVSQATEYVRQTAFGLQYAYEQGLVHRDIKPANLFVSFQGDHAWILDIGLARLEWSYSNRTPKQTPTGQGPVMGTPDYIAPEQALDPQQANIRADIYSLGCTLYHLLTGQPPFPGNSLTRKLLDHQQTPPPSARQARPEVPPELAAIIQKMMSKAPDERYQTPAGVAVALRPYCQNRSSWIPLETFRTRQLDDDEDDSVVMELRAPPPSPPRAPEKPAAKPSGESWPGHPERRIAARRQGNPVPVLVSDAMSKAEPAHGWIVDRSSTGLGILADEAIELGTTITVRADVPVGARWFPCRVIHCNAERASWRVGLQFSATLSWSDLRAFG